MSYKSRYDRGSWAVICDSCGRKYKASELQKRWDGLMVCQDDWEPRQPQDFVRGVADNQAPPWTRPEPSDNFIPFHFTPLLSYVTKSILKLTFLIFRQSKKQINASAINSTTIG